jgi:hypothetical protein
MKSFWTRAAFALALLAVASASFVAPAHAGKRLLEVRNKTDYVLHFTYALHGANARTEVAVLPGGTWGLDAPGSYWFDGVLKKNGAVDIPLQRHGILLKETQGVLMVLLAVYDNVGSKSYRWYAYNQS